MEDYEKVLPWEVNYEDLRLLTSSIAKGMQYELAKQIKLESMLKTDEPLRMETFMFDPYEVTDKQRKREIIEGEIADSKERYEQYKAMLKRLLDEKGKRLGVK